MVKLLLEYNASPYISTIRDEYGNVLMFVNKTEKGIEIRTLILERIL
jgi:hypothetical protein